MDFPFPSLGIVFNIDGLGGGYYGFKAWKIFMAHVDPCRLGPSVLVEGDTAATLNGNANEFCIGVYTPGDIEYIREQFEPLDEEGLAPVHRRFIEKAALDPQPLPERGYIDALGRLIADEWDGATHRLCMDAGWSYAPKSVPREVVDPRVLAEIETLRRPRI